MNINELIREISRKDVDIDKFVRLVIGDGQIRDAIIDQMITNPDIMVYYHCYYVISKASKEQPDLFYKYWDVIASLLNHENSYHRDFGLTIMATLTQVDRDDLFTKLFDDYFVHINDPKFSTARCCVQNSLLILRSKPELKNQIITLLLNIENICRYSDKQKGLLMYDILVILDEVYLEEPDKEGLNAFIRACTYSLSPKTRKKARELAGKYDL